ncbi:MAG: hypothetical protein AAFQ94_29615 [Bacteroidota bacterium]
MRIKKKLSLTLFFMLASFAIVSAQSISGPSRVCSTGSNPYSITLPSNCSIKDWTLSTPSAGQVTVAPDKTASVIFNGLSYGGLEQVTLEVTYVCIEEGDFGGGIPIQDEVVSKVIKLQSMYDAVTSNATPTISGPNQVVAGDNHSFVLSRPDAGADPYRYRWYLNNSYLGQTVGTSREIDFDGITPGSYTVRCVPVNACGVENPQEMDHTFSVSVICETPQIVNPDTRSLCVRGMSTFTISGVTNPIDYYFVHTGATVFSEIPGSITLQYYNAGEFTVYARRRDSNCSAEVSETVNVVVTADPVVDYSEVDTEVCATQPGFSPEVINLSVSGSYQNIIWEEVVSNGASPYLEITPFPGGQSAQIKYFGSFR